MSRWAEEQAGFAACSFAIYNGTTMTNQSSPNPSRIKTNPTSRDAWERYTWLWTGSLFLGLIIGLVLFFQEESLPANLIWLAVGLNMGLVAWHVGALYLFRRLGHFRENLPFAIIYVTGLIALWFGLIRVDSAFYVAQMGLWSQAFIALPIGWAAVFAILIFTLNFYQQTIGSSVAPDWSSALLWLGFTSIGILFGYWIHTIITQSMERKELIEQLEETRAELAKSERAAGTSAERQRLAHEIHDTLAQGFISIIMHLEAAEQALPDDASAKAARHLSQARQTARESLEQARRVVNDLRPEPLEGAPFDEAVQRVAADWSAGNGITAVFTRTGDCHPLHPEVEVTLLRAAQEALANIRKHAQASQVQVTLSYLGDVVILDVEDDGVGFMMGESEGKTAVSGKFGLVAMRQRVEQLGGQLLIESEPGEGTTVAVSIPVISEQ
ncbi:MAG: sensor histidine kinase [Chloroflexi bacterium]|nr:sensor histidine kinase [Chloroflexota bacterium]